MPRSTKPKTGKSTKVQESSADPVESTASTVDPIANAVPETASTTSVPETTKGRRKKAAKPEPEPVPEPEPEPEPEPVVVVAKKAARRTKKAEPEPVQDPEPEPEPEPVQEPEAPKKKPGRQRAKKSKNDDQVEKPVDSEEHEQEPANDSDSSEKKPGDKQKRVFEIIPSSIEPLDGAPEITGNINKTGNGAYKGFGPTQASTKAFRRICKLANVEGDLKYIFAIQERRTQSAPRYYLGHRTKAENAKSVKFANGDAYTPKYKNTVKAHKKDTKE